MRALPRATFGIRLHQLARVWRQHADATLRELGVSEATAWPLRLMSRMDGGVRQRTLAEAAGIEGPTLVRLLDSLEAAGLIVRRADVSDRRANTLSLTTEGRAMVDRIEAVLARERQRLLRDVSDDDLTIALRVFDRIDAVIRADRGGATQG